MQKLTLFLISIFSSAAVCAQEPLPDPDSLEVSEPAPRRYTVEVIVFAYADDVSAGSEVFLPDVIEIVPSDSLALYEPGGEGTIPDDSTPTYADAATDTEELEEPGESLFEMVLLADDELTMIDILDRLDRLDSYLPLMHLGWTQTVLPEEDTPALDLREFGKPPPGLAGTLTLYLSRYLHLFVDLELDAVEPPEPGSSEPEADRSVEQPIVRYNDDRAQNESDTFLFDTEVIYEPLRYQISENRLFKNGETRYYDHPRFGVIAKVLRVEEEEEEFIPDDTEFLSPAVVSE